MRLTLLTSPKSLLGMPLILLILMLPLTGVTQSKSKVAVMPISLETSNLSKATVKRATEYLRGGIAEVSEFVVIAKERQNNKLKKLIKRQKKESYKECYKESCQIPLGQQLAADSILRSKVTYFDTCVLSVELVDLAKEATVAAERVSFNCSVEDLRRGIDDAVSTIAKYRRSRQQTQGRQSFKVTFDTDPAGADILKNDEPVCLNTPCLASIETGRYKFTVKKEGYRTRKRDISINQSTDEVNLKLLESGVRKDTASSPIQLVGGFLYGFPTSSSATADAGGRTESFEQSISSQKGVFGEVGYAVSGIVVTGLRLSYESYGVRRTSNSASITSAKIHPKVNILPSLKQGAIYFGMPIGGVYASGIDGQRLNLEPTTSWGGGLTIAGAYELLADATGFCELSWGYRSLPHSVNTSGANPEEDVEYDLSHYRFALSAGLQF